MLPVYVGSINDLIAKTERIANNARLITTPTHPPFSPNNKGILFPKTAINQSYGKNAYT